MDSPDDHLSDHEASGPIAWMASNPIAANLLMVILLAGGVWTAINIQKEVFPQFQLDIVEVSVSYPGAAPDEVEQGILLPIEETIRGVQGIKEMNSRAWEGSGRVSVELVPGTDRMKAFQDIDQAVNRIRTFPDDIDQPRVRLDSQIRDVMEIGLFGEVDIWTLRQLAERLRDRLLNDPSISQVEIGRVPDYITHVEIPMQRLREYGLTLGDVAGIIRQSSEDIPAGTVETTQGQILLRMKERKQWAEEFGKIEIIASDTGASVVLADIAEITDGFEEAGFHSRFNGQPSVELEIFRIGDQSPLEIAAAVERILEEAQATFPPGVQTRIDSSRARDFSERLSLLIKNGGMAIVIVLLILALFLEFRLAFWVMMGMTISFIGGLIFLPTVDVSINMISMFAFLVVLGIVVDDAIVVGENIYEYRQKGMGFLPAAIRGTRDIAGPVTFSILTNIVAFIPLLFMPGTTGKFWWPLPVVVIIVLAVSLFEALYILPAHLAHAGEARGTGIGGRLHHLQQRFSRGFSRFVDTYYRAFLALCLRNRYVTISGAIALFVVVGSFGMSGHMGMIMMPQVAANEIEAGVRLPQGVTPQQSAAVALDVTRSTQRMFEEHDLWREAEGIKSNVRGDSFIDVEIVLKPPTERDMTVDEIIELWRDQIGDIAGVDEITFEAEHGPGGWRKDISIDLSHNDPELLGKIAPEFAERLEVYEAARDIGHNFWPGKDQFDFILRPEGRALGLTANDVGRQVRDAFYGAVALRYLRGTNEVEVRVKLPKDEREDMHHLENFIVLAPDGTEVPLTEAVEMRPTQAYSSVERRDGRRVVNVSLNVEPEREMSSLIESFKANDLPKLQADYPGITWSFEGAQAEMRESTAALWGGFGLAMGVIYSLLAIAFRSYTQPLIVMVAIPFGIIGAVIGHLLLGHDLSLISLMGVIALSGVVVNDSLIMIDFANRNRLDQSAHDAILQAGCRRFRPIILTTLTTFGGLTPIILETSRQATYLIPMAISLGFGIVFATGIILLLVPSLYLVLEDIAGLFGARAAPDPVELAKARGEPATATAGGGGG